MLPNHPIILPKIEELRIGVLKWFFVTLNKKFRGLKFLHCLYRPRAVQFLQVFHHHISRTFEKSNVQLTQ